MILQSCFTPDLAVVDDDELRRFGPSIRSDLQVQISIYAALFWRTNFVFHSAKTPCLAPNVMMTATYSRRLSMLVLSRKKNESIIINDDITVTVVEIRGDKVRLGIVAPKQIPVHRQEVHEAIHGTKAPETTAATAA
jgi:carbon storage regulator